MLASIRDILRWVINHWVTSITVFVAILVVAIALSLLDSDQPVTPGSRNFKTISDGAGGVIVSWWDPSSGDISIQHINNNGDVIWGDGGVIVAKGISYNFEMKADGMGGTIITWENAPTAKYPAPEVYDPIPVYSQRINAEGNLLWGSGIPTGVDGVNVEFPAVLPDGNGGMLIGWDDFTPVYNKGYVLDDVFRLQKFSPEGQPLWGGKGISGIPSTRLLFDGGDDGVLLFWSEPKYSPGQSPKHPLYAQQIESHGEFIWPRPKLINENFNDYYCVSSTNLSGGQILLSLRNSTYSKSDTIFLCLDKDANQVWMQKVSNENGRLEVLAADGLGGFILARTYSTFRDPKAPWDEYVYMQRLNQESNALWDDSQPILHSTDSAPIGYKIVSDGTGGTMLIWWVEGNIFAQRFDENGPAFWPQNRAEGVPVLINDEIRYRGVPEIIRTDSGAIIVVVASEEVIYAQKLDINWNYLWGDGIWVDIGYTTQK